MKRNLKVYFIILLTLFSSSILIKAENQEIKTLISFKESSISSDPKNFLSNWSLNSSSPCSFVGITCSNDRHVTTLNLSGASLSGTLRLDKITILPFLTHVDFTGNFFSGNLSGESPTECSLESLNLSYNNFSKPISINISCNNFLSLNLSNNRVPGGALNLSPSLSSLDLSGNRILNASLFSLFITKNQNLNFLNLSHNKMRGDFEFMANISQNIKVLDLSHNNFTQNLASFQFSSCRNLSVLYLSDNALFSSVSPSFFTSCPLLEVLDLGNNTLEFAISGNMLGNLKNLRKLNLARNRLFGEIPFEFGENCAKIQELDLSGNNLTGGLPLSFSNSSIISLNLGYNRLSGDFLGIFDSLFGLRYLNMSFNNLTGELPLSLSSNSRIVELDLSSNGFIGKIPSGFCSLSPFPVLEKLLLANNYFSGTIPSELGKCKNLVQIDFSFNELGGEIPIEIWNLPKISDLAMWANNITGELPEGICTNGGNLQTLILNNNLISGNIPHSIANCTNLVWVSLSSNLLTGTIPIGIGNLINLAILQLGDNSLSGQIPREIGGCRSLIWLDLNSNKFNGNIPFELSENAGFVKPGPVSGKHYAFVRNEGGTACRGAGGLVEFDGIRAKRLENFPMVHSCPWTRIFTGTTVYMFSSNGSMIYLDLSYNMLSGTIPQNMGSMAYLQVLNLGHNKLTGNIPFEFGGLRYIGVLDLSYNKLQGMIPGSLGRLTFLNDLDVSNNHLFGAIPSGGQLYTFSPSRYENNTGLCGVPLPPCRPKDGPPHSATSNKNKTRKEILTAEMIIGVGVCLLCITALMLALYRLKRKHNKMRKGDKYIDSLPTSGTNSWKLSGVAEPLSINVATFENPLRKLTFAHLLKATNGFSSESLIGAGGFGEVYKAQLKDGSIVAIKKLINATSQGEREFVAEMETIGKIRHQNLVPLLGYCKVGEERLLVYDYMKWGSLESVLHENNESKLNWASRKKIAIGSARGLAFLHHSCIPHIIHRDMKSSNILLDENFDARVSDFGMARLVSALDTHLSVSTLAGTPGYVPPEYYQSFRCTAKGDVYSYGVILLELLSGKRPIDPSEFGEDNNLVGWAKQLHTEKRTNEILDPVLASKESIVAELYQCLEIAFVCVDDRSFRRPTMMHVLSMFKDIHTDLEGDVLDDVALKSTVIEERQDKETVLKARATFSINVENE